jgi:hypothetical protein
MAYTDKNYKTKKALKEDFAAGKTITVYQPGPFGSTVADGNATIEGPHYPEPHKWYAAVTVENGVITKIK